MKGYLQIAAGVALGNMIAEKFVLRQGPMDTTGFVDISEGFGLDDVARAVVVTAAVVLVRRFT